MYKSIICLCEVFAMIYKRKGFEYQILLQISFKKITGKRKHSQGIKEHTK